MKNDIPDDLKYTSTHEWIQRDENEYVTIGITAFAQHALGDIVFIELPEVGTSVNSGKECGVIESVKAASDLYSPISGEVVAINEKVKSDPALINHDPYHEGWLIKILPDDINEWDDLLDAEQYAKKIE